MLFNSLEFVVFFFIVYGLYSALGHRRQNLLLLVAGYTFYGAWDYRFLALLATSTCIDYYIGLALSRQHTDQGRKRWIIVSVFVNLGILGFFKYFNFFAGSLVDMASAFGVTLSPVTLQIILPVGISFYTFQSMSYTIEVYRKRMEPCRSLFDFAVYVSFFPQLVAGPIERATNLIRQVVTPRVITADKIGMGLSLILLGYFKKVVMADNLSPTVDAIFNKPGPYTGEEVVIGVVFFAFQIYGDFSGYTDIARGIARLMGFELITNFREPYFARSPSDFWHRWHISLSSWLRDYLYISLGGNRGARWKTYRNLMLTMILGGLWHGAHWNFVLWGLFHGTLLVAYKAHEDIRRSDTSNITKTDPWHAVVSTAIMFLFTLYSWLLFRANSAAQIVDLTLALGRFTSVKPLLARGVKLVFYVWPIVLLDYLKFRSNDDEPILTRAPIGVQSACYAVLMLIFVVFGRYEGASFIYFQF